ncbi:MAG: hypothetical protein OXB90_06535 [Acidimicrobiaceae bacterium]|nr:hypothetical protein [Acidimicrobiaceae bacterium]
MLKISGLAGRGGVSSATSINAAPLQWLYPGVYVTLPFDAGTASIRKMDWASAITDSSDKRQPRRIPGLLGPRLLTSGGFYAHYTSTQRKVKNRSPLMDTPRRIAYCTRPDLTRFGLMPYGCQQRQARFDSLNRVVDG